MRRRRLSTRILVSQLAVLLVAVAAGFALFVRALRHDLDIEYEQRALVIAQAAASDPQIEQAMAAGDPDHRVAQLAERIRQSTGASYVVVLDESGIRHSHPNPALIGKPVAEPLVALDGQGHVGVDNGHLGRSANGKAPLRAPDGRIIGEVSAGLLESEVTAAMHDALPTLFLYAGLALTVGALASFGLARRLKRQTFGLELDEIAGLLQEREAMLHGISDGVITVGPSGRVSLINDEARRLLGLGAAALHQPLDRLLPAGRLRDLLTGAEGDPVEATVLTADRCLVVTRMTVVRDARPLGAVITLRDRTELVSLLRELDGVRSLTDALRAQQHEHANRMHTLAGLLELGRYDDAAEYLTELSGTATAVAEALRDRIGNPTVVALLLAKRTIAAERGVELVVADDEPAEPAIAEDIEAEPRTLVTILGNLIDNAIDAASGSPAPRVTVRFRKLAAGDVALEVEDTGPGVADPEAIFVDGYTSKAPRDGFHRGLGLALVHRLVTQAGGSIEVENQGGALFRVTLPARRLTAARRPEW